MTDDTKTNDVTPPAQAAKRDAPIVVVTATPVTPPSPAPAEIIATWRELRGPWRVFAMSEWIMRDRASFFEEVRTRHDLTPKLRSMIVSSIIYLALYGIVLGSSNSWLQAGLSAIKLPRLLQKSWPTSGTPKNGRSL